MKAKKFHLKDFPEDRIRILLNDNAKFLDESIKYFGSLNKLAEFLEVSSQVINSWKNLNLFIPLNHIKRIVNERKLDWDNIERNVLAYKGPNLSLVITNPKLPIIESPELFAIIGHLIGDGSVNKNGIPIYTNSNKQLIENFQKLIKYVFGDVEDKIYTIRPCAYQYRTSKVIADLIKSFYNTEFHSLIAKLPEKVFELSEEFSCAIIRAIVDDEGCIRDNRITIKMKNKYLILQIRDILSNLLSVKAVTEPAERRDGSWEVSIKSGYLEDFGKKIKLVHPIKIESINYAIEKAEYRKISHKDNRWKTKLAILKILIRAPQTIKNLGRKLFIDRINVISHINDLKKKLLIKKINYKGSFKCFITKQGKLFLNENLPSSKKVAIKTDKINYNNLNKKQNRILLNDELREKVFRLLEVIYGNQEKISKLLNVHRNTITNWKIGKTLIPSSTLNSILILLGQNGINLVKEIETNINDIRTSNGKYKIYGGENYGIHLCGATIA